MRKISNLALFAFLMPLAGCPAGDDTETDTVAETANMTSAPGTETGSDTVTPAESGTADSGTAGGTADSGTGPGGAGFCATTCAAVADCVPPMGMESDYACTDGFCEYIGEPLPCDPALCDDLGVGLACADVDGVSQCTTPCSDDSMCLAGVTECTGMDDAGNSICVAVPAEPCGGAAEGEPCNFGGADQYGVCTDGVCSCTDDAECTAAGQGCNPG
jgi:hypothetical protein